MEVGIIGFERSGKTTLFNALTGQEAATGYGGKGAEPNIAIVKVPDERLDKLSALFQSKKYVPATIKYIDVAGIPAREGKAGGSLSDALMNAVANCDALMAVVRGFEEGGVAAKLDDDAESIQAELIIADLLRVETRLERIGKTIAKQVGDARKALDREQAVMIKCKAGLEAERPVRELEFDVDEMKTLRAFQFMTAKPLILLANLGESDGALAAEVEGKLRAKGLPRDTAAVACCALNEMEISRIEDPAERKEFLAGFGIERPAAERVIQTTYETCGLMSFFTVGPTEAHAWTIRRGQSALEAAGTIHSDLARGFIRAEVIGWEELLKAGSLAAAKSKGSMRLEGKTYVMQDGDVIEVRFSV